MVNEGEPLQGGHQLDFGSGRQDPPPPPAAPSPPAAPDVPVPPAQPDPIQPQPPQYGQPAQPYGAQPTQPYGAQPAQPYGAQPTQPYGAQPYPGQPGEPRKSSKGLLWGLIGGGVVVLIAIVLIVALLVVPAITRSSATAADAVKGYLTAVSHSDAKTALGYLESAPDTTLLTDAVLKESNKLAPLGHIAVKQARSSSSSSEVAATFTLGDKKVVTTYGLYKTKDAWKLADGVQPISLSTLKGLDATINGVSTAKLDQPYVFPGTYALSLASKYFSFSGDSTFTIATENDTSALYDVKVALNDAGTTEYRSLVRASVEVCVAMKTLATPCGMDITSIDLSGATPVEGSVTRTLTAEGSAALNALQPEVSGSTPTVVTSYDSVSVDMSLQGSDGQTYTVTSGGYLDTPKVDFAAAVPKVVWEQ
ncbi:hypothetical protein [Microbacterium panaciterrae]|uniref:DUF4878 domain-containing protein n=1 Tax=Microbacterium panaciterrae TaxID=985759 RepID=A0ABP8PLY0_9MICO